MQLYDVSPRVVGVGERTEITIRPLYAHVGFPNEIYRVKVVGMDDKTSVEYYVRVTDGDIHFSLTCGREQEYSIILDDGRRFCVYAVEDDLLNRIPLKGDLHLHSICSDGVESPAFVIASARKIGMDFAAITDHRRYQPSLDAIEAFRDFDTDMLIVPGEEVHPPRVPVHIINFGGSFSVNSLFDEKYAAEVARLAEAIPDAGIDRNCYAACKWCFDKIEEGGGISLFCHPLWVTEGAYNVDAEMTDYMMAHKPFTAFELLGGHEQESNNLQVAYYNQKRAEGLRIPAVGVSDAHGCSETSEYFGWTYTIAFAHENTLPAIKESVKNFYTAAVEQMPGESPHVYGEFRLVKYARFLLREYFPAHDERCRREGMMMLEHISR